ncbi:PREDICTED: FAD-dependent oxidoreductase domain-containing protein 1-like [Ceratosolen solmsi marchali]|uniref:FAD-dependent oxidoreductase domain-containing protein 1 n=1 Tax=Ceratosolen solmsi marchali TaxID=326594 RepID=A0AAJ6YXF9_9HYME|nr:PREDICTED: FAD-dependent oxidoreductase domain-containing protein 1-like [Ceratosolen solmsi marchali]
MLCHFIKTGSNKINFSYARLCHLYSTKATKDSKDVSEIKDMKAPHPDPMTKIRQCLQRDAALIKNNLTFWKDKPNPALDKDGRVINWDNPNAPIFPNYCDILIIGGGAIGSSIAYWCKRLGKASLRVAVVEKDPTYKQASTVLSVGGLRQQFSLEENIEMSLFGAEFLRNINQYLGIEGEPPVDVQFHPYGYLSLAKAEHSELLKKNSELQNSLGARNVILNAKQLKYKFPWLTTDDIEIGCLGLENEGWFDPWSLLYALKCKALSLGVDYVTAEAKGFSFKIDKNAFVSGVQQGEHQQLEYLVVQTEDGQLRPMYFSKCIIAAGAFSGNIAKMAKIGYDKDMLSVPLPVEPRKRYVYCFHAPSGPGLNIPLTIDPTGTYFRREGLANYYICGLSPEEDEEPSIDNLDVDQYYFENKIWPILAKRVKTFENLKIKSSWAGYYEYNTYDENGIIGYHPYHDNLIICTGFSGHGIQQAPAVGRAVSELIEHKEYTTINLSRLSFERFIINEPIKENNIW